MSELLDENVDTSLDAVDTTTDGAAVDAADAVARAEDTAEPVAPSAPQIDWNDPAVQQQIGGLSQQSALALLESLGLVSYEQEQIAPPDPLSDNYAQEQERYLEAQLQRHLGPVQQYIQAQQQQETNTMIDSALSAAATAANLSGADSSLLRSVAAHFATQPEYARYGATPQGVQATARAAAEWLASERKSAADAAVVAYRKQIGEIQDTPAEPNAGGAGGLPITAKPKTYDEIIAAHVGRFS